MQRSQLKVKPIMAKYSGTQTFTRGSGPLTATGSTVTHEGGTGFTKDPKTELFTLAATSLMGESSFYESAGARDSRLVRLVTELTASEPEFIQKLVPYLRNVQYLRSASLVIAIEYAAAGGPNGRNVVASAMSRADEPCEAVGYWFSTRGRRSLPHPIRKGINDAIARLWNEYSVIKYDTTGRAIRFADVIALTHPKPDPALDAFRTHLGDRRHGRTYGDDIRYNDTWLRENGLNKLADTYSLDARLRLPAQRSKILADPTALDGTAYTWERLNPSNATEWEAVIPHMGYMARLRNIRNWEQAGVDKMLLARVASELADPDAVAKSRQMPFRFMSAWKHSGSMIFGPALETALDLSVQNIPKLSGRTLVLIDTSGSMQGYLSKRGSVRPVDAAAVFGAAATARMGDVTTAIYAASVAPVKLSTSILRSIDQINNLNGSVGHSTNTWPSVAAMYRNHDRVLVLTDMQDHPADNWRGGASSVPANVPVYVWDLSGERATNIDTSVPNRYLLTGFTDAMFKLIPLLEAGQSQDWDTSVLA